MNTTTGRIGRLLAVLVGCGGIAAAGAQELPLGDISLEDLVKLEVLTVSRKAQKISDTPAAVTVVTADDIRRSGARSIPEALRLVPGVDVAQIAAGRYAVGVRGFNSRFSNALLVQVDGRSVYSPFFSGVFWETLNLMLEDIERIEVVRGPGSALWGANAVNGVINIVSRRASATQGALASVSVDDRGKPTGAARYGATIDGVGALRLFANGAELSPSRDSEGNPANDAANGWRAGFRLDSVGWARGTWSLQGEAWEARTKETFLLPSITTRIGSSPMNVGLDHDGAHLLGRASFELAGGEMSIQGFVDHSKAALGVDGNGAVDTADFDLQHRFAPWERHSLLLGLGYRYSRTEINANGWVLRVAPSVRRLRVASAFVQDEITLEPGTWKLTLGAKAEDASISGAEIQPNVRLMWTPTSVDSGWASYARAVRTPSVGEADATMTQGVRATPPGSLFPAVGVVTRPLPGNAMQAEQLDAGELGYRRNLGNGSVEAVAFYHQYRKLLGTAVDPGLPQFPGSIRLPFPPFSLPDVYVNRSNLLAGHSQGIELALDLPVTAQTRLHATYAFLDTDLGRYADPATDAAAQRIETSAPRHSATLRLASTFACGHEFDIIARYVGSVQQGLVPAYTAVDLRYGWKLNRHFELAIIGQNLFDPLHLEYVTDFLPSMPAYQARRGYVQATWRY